MASLLASPNVWHAVQTCDGRQCVSRFIVTSHNKYVGASARRREHEGSENADFVFWGFRAPETMR